MPAGITARPIPAVAQWRGPRGSKHSQAAVGAGQTTTPPTAVDGSPEPNIRAAARAARHRKFRKQHKAGEFETAGRVIVPSTTGTPYREVAEVERCFAKPLVSTPRSRASMI